MDIKKISLILISFLVIIGLNACDSDDEEKRQSVYTESEVDTSLYRDQLPLIIYYTVSTSEIIEILMFNCYADTVDIIVNEELPAGSYRAIYEFPSDSDDGFYCLNFNIIREDTVFYTEDRILSIRTRVFSNEFKQFANDHFNTEKYTDYEYFAASGNYPYHEERFYYQGTRDEWVAMSWESKLRYIPDHFTHNVNDFYEERFYSSIADNPEQFGGGWDDAVNNDDYGVSTMFWNGTSTHLDEYLEMYNDQ